MREVLTVSKITPGTLIVAIFAILFGLVGAYALKIYLAPEAEAEVAEGKPPQEYKIPFASDDLVAGRPLTMGDMVIIPMTLAQMKQRGLPDKVMANTQQIIGRIPRHNIKKDEEFTTSQFYPEGMGPSVADRLRPGLRAVTIAINSTGAVDGYAEPGSTVDVLFRTDADAKNAVPEMTVTLLESVEVLAVGGNSVPGAHNAKDPKTVTLAVTASQGNALKIVEGRGAFSLALRNSKDGTRGTPGGPRTLDSLLTIPRKPVPFTTEIYRGGSRQTLIFQGDAVTQETFGGMPIAATAHEPKQSLRTSVHQTP